MVVTERRGADSPTGGLVVFASDLDLTAAFYEAVLRRSRVDEDDSWVRFDGPHELVVHAIPGEFAAGAEPGDPPSLRDDAAIKPWFVVGSLAAAREQFDLHGGRLLDESQEWRFDGWIVCDGSDPDGNVIQLREAVD